MTYPNEFKPEQRFILSEFSEAVKSLHPGESLVIEHKDKRELEYRRYLLYAWLSPKHENKKELFRISTISPTKFRVSRRAHNPALVTTPENKVENFVKAHLLEVTQEDLCLKIIRGKIKDPEEQIRVYKEWQSQQG